MTLLDRRPSRSDAGWETWQTRSKTRLREYSLLPSTIYAPRPRSRRWEDRTRVRHLCHRRPPRRYRHPADPPSVARARRPRSGARNEASRMELRLLRPREWDEEKDYNERPPKCLHYIFEWCAVVNGKEVLRDTEPDLVLNPAACWQLFLQQRMQTMVLKHLDRGSSSRVDHIVVVASVVNCRSARKLTKRFESEIDWRVVEDQLDRWSDLFEAGAGWRMADTWEEKKAELIQFFSAQYWFMYTPRRGVAEVWKRGL